MRTNGQISPLRSGASAERRCLVSAQMAALCRDAAPRNSRALTLLEMMVSMTLLAVIMVGLLAMFSHTQKALHVAATQTDVFENARGAIQIMARDLSELSAYDDTNVTTVSAIYLPHPAGDLTLTGTGGAQRIGFTEAFWLNRVNDQWQGTGYYVERGNLGVGTLYRYSETTNHGWAPSLFSRFNTLPSLFTNRVSDGIVHFQLTAVYLDVLTTNFLSDSDFTFSNVLPAFVDIDLGVLEPGTLKQFESLAGNPAAAKKFLIDQVGRIHFFRERVPVRNFVNPYRANEVP